MVIKSFEPNTGQEISIFMFENDLFLQNPEMNVSRLIGPHIRRFKSANPELFPVKGMASSLLTIYNNPKEGNTFGNSVYSI